MTNIDKFMGVDVTHYPRDFCLERVRDMLRIRLMEERCAQLFSDGRIRGFLQLYIGEEAVAAGVMPNLLPEDNVVASCRAHAYAVLRGVSMASVIAELYGAQEGCSGGSGGSMHLFDRGTRFFGGTGTAGGGLPLAVGLALADKLAPPPGCVTACFLGEGTVAKAAFHESMNLAVQWRLPVLFICENNLYAMGTALSRSESEIDLTKKAASYGMPTGHGNGMKVLDVYDAARQAAAFVREQQSPFFLELHTYRMRVHAMVGAGLYRDREEVDRWKQHGPIQSFTDKLKAAHMVSESELAQIADAATQEVDAAVAAPMPSGTTGYEPAGVAKRAAWPPQAAPIAAAQVGLS